MTDNTRTRFGRISLFSRNCRMTFRRYCHQPKDIVPAQPPTSRLTSSSAWFLSPPEVVAGVLAPDTLPPPATLVWPVRVLSMLFLEPLGVAGVPG